MHRRLLSVLSLGIAGVLLLSSAALGRDPAWHLQDSNSIKVLKGIEFVDDCHGWAVGEPTDGVPNSRTPIFATSNAGKTWTKQASGLVDTTLNRVDFVDTQHGWAIGEPFDAGNPITAGGSTGPGTIIHTTNGGLTWHLQTNNAPKNNFDYEGLSFVTSMKGWIAASGAAEASTGAILRTINGGASYVSQVVPNPSDPVADVYFVDGQYGWAVTDGGSILHTTNGGAPGPSGWTVQFSTKANWEAIAFYNRRLGVAVTDNGGGIWFTKDGGAHWSQSLINSPLLAYRFNQFTDVTYPSPDLVAVSAEQADDSLPSVIMISHTGGHGFKPQRVNGTSLNLNSIAFPRGSDDGWASGENGTILSNDREAPSEC